jgi:hypothetical protein
MEKGAIKLVVFNGEDFGYWKNQTRNYLLSQGRAIWEIVQEVYVTLMMLDNVTQDELTRYDVSDALSFESLSLRVAKLGNALCNQDKLLCNVFRENKKLNLELESSCSKFASIRSAQDDMSAKLCKNCKMIMVNYADLWLVHTQVTSRLKGIKLKLSELKAHSMLLGACTS